MSSSSDRNADQFSGIFDRSKGKFNGNGFGYKSPPPKEPLTKLEKQLRKKKAAKERRRRMKEARDRAERSQRPKASIINRAKKGGQSSFRTEEFLRSPGARMDAVKHYYELVDGLPEEDRPGIPANFVFPRQY